jgi:hypothetical protein
VSPVRYELDFYILFRTNSDFKGLKRSIDGVLNGFGTKRISTKQR